MHVLKHKTYTYIHASAYTYTHTQELSYTLVYVCIFFQSSFKEEKYNNDKAFLPILHFFNCLSVLFSCTPIPLYTCISASNDDYDDTHTTLFNSGQEKEKYISESLCTVGGIAHAHSIDYGGPKGRPPYAAF